MGSQSGCSESPAPDAGFQTFLEAALQDIPPGIAEQLKAGLMKRYNKPPIEEMELCLGRSVPLQKARQILFAPDEEDMRLYPDLIAMPPPGAPDNHPQRSVQVCALASLYLVHSRSWERVRPFIEAGGLRQLCSALSHPNPYLASQAMSALLHLTDEEAVFPWHDPPPAPDGRGPRQGPYAAVWRRMFELSRGALLPALLSHYRQPPAFPGASDMALRLLAFYLSWLRKHFTQDGRLSLSAGLLALLQRWGADPAAGQEERQLAQQLHADFSRFPPAQEPIAASLSSGEGSSANACDPEQRQQQQSYLGGLSGGDDEDLEVAVVSERTAINSGPSQDNEAELLRERGNEAYRRGDYSAAVHLYSAALDVPVPAEGPRILSEGPRRAAYHANRAAAYMARAAAPGQLREGESDTAGHLEGLDLGSEGAAARHYQAAVIDCDMALDMEPAGPGAAKTCLRKCRALRRLARDEEAAAAARAGLVKYDSAGGSGSSGGGGGSVVSELQEELRALEKLFLEGKKEEGRRKQAQGKVGEGGEVGGKGEVTAQTAAAAEGDGGGKGGAQERCREGAGRSAIDWNAMD